MSRAGTDQAEGLRRLIDRSGLQVVSVSRDGGDQPGAIVNLAGALAELGRDVLILDEQTGARGITGALGLKPRFDLGEVIAGRRELDDMIVTGPAGIRVLSLAHCRGLLSELSEREQRRLVERFGRLSVPVDTLLVQSASGQASSLLSCGTGVREVVVLAGGGAREITAGYALIKRLNNEFARHEFHVLVSNVASENMARTIVSNMATVARRYLRVSLDFIGNVPPDEKLQHAARLGLPVVAAFPAAAAAASFRGMAQAIAAWPRGEDGICGLGDIMSRVISSNNQRTAAA